MTTPAHSPLGPSSAHRWMNCPGSVKASESIPDKATSYSIEGTAAHTLTEWCRLKNRKAEEYLGETISVKRGNETYGILVTQEMVEAVQTFVDYVSDTCGDMLVEERVSYEEFVPGGFGTLDDARLRQNGADIADFKYGQGVPVDAQDNEQMKLYALGIYLKYDWMYQFDWFRLHIVQPRIDHITQWTISKDDLLAWAKTTLTACAKATQAEDAPFKAGEWCRFCRVRETCRTRAESVFETVVGDFENLEAAVGKVGKTPTLTNDEVALVLNAAGSIEKWLEDIKAYAMREVQHGHPVGDYKLVEGRGGREWAVDEAALKTAWVGAGHDPLELHEVKLITPAKAEKIAGKKSPLWKTAGLINKVKGKPTLAPGKDPRPPITVDANTEFDVVEDPAN